MSSNIFRDCPTILLVKSTSNILVICLHTQHSLAMGFKMSTETPGVLLASLTKQIEYKRYVTSKEYQPVRLAIPASTISTVFVSI